MFRLGASRLLHAQARFAETIQLNLPALSPTMNEGTLVRWLVKEGDFVKPGQGLFEVETDKSVMTADAVDSGYIAKIIVPSGSKGIQIGQLVALQVEEKDEVAVMPNIPPPKQVTAPPTSAAPAAPTSVAPATPKAVSNATTKPLSPAVRNLIDIHHLKVDSIPATGPRGRLLKEDVLNFIQNGGQTVPPAPKPAAATPSKQAPVAPVPASGIKPSLFVDTPVDEVRRGKANQIVQAKNAAPQNYASIDIDLSKVQSNNQDGQTSVESIVLKAAAAALRLVPDINSTFVNGQVVPSRGVDINVLVESSNGFVSALIPKVDRVSPSDLTTSLKAFSKIPTGSIISTAGTFTVHNLAVFGINSSTAVVSTPQVAALSYGAPRAVFNPSTNSASFLTTFTLSFDTRAIDEETATLWLTTLRNVIEDLSIIRV